MRNKFTIIMTLVFLFVLTGCGSATANKDPLIGKWEDQTDTVTFNEDGTFTSFFYFGAEGGAWGYDSENSEKLVLNIPDLGKDYYLYEIDGDTLTLTRTYVYPLGDPNEWTVADSPSYVLSRVED